METLFRQKCRWGVFDVGYMFNRYISKFIGVKKGIWTTGSFFCAHERRKKGGKSNEDP